MIATTIDAILATFQQKRHKKHRIVVVCEQRGKFVELQPPHQQQQHSLQC